jgi:CHAT domain-containing protein
MKLQSFFAVLIFHSAINFAAAQSTCDTSTASKTIALARETFQTERFAEAPVQILSALPLLEKCQDANNQMATIYEQAGAWYTALEKFELADENLLKALKLLPENAARIAGINLLQARLGLASRNFDACKTALEAVFAARAPLNEAIYAEAWIIRAKMYYLLTKPEAGAACLDSAMALSAFHKSLSLKAEAWSTRVELDLLSGDLKLGLTLADSVLSLLANESSASIQETRYRMLEISMKISRSIVGIKDGHIRILQATALAASMPPYLRVRYLPSALCASILSTFEQAGEEASDSIFMRLEKMLEPERISHKAYQAEAYTQRARTFNLLGQFEQGVALCAQSNAILKSLPGYNNQRISVNYMYQAASYRQMGDNESAISAGELALALREKEQPGFIGLGAIYNELVHTYLQSEDTAKLSAILIKFEQLLAGQKDKSNNEQYSYVIAFGWLEYWKQAAQPLKGIPQAENFLKVSGAKARMRGTITADMEYKICDAYRDAGQYREAFDRLEPLVVRFKKRYQESGSIFYEHYSWVLAQSAYNALIVFNALGDTAMLRVAEMRCAEAEELLFALRQRDPHEGQRKFVTDEFLYKNLMRVRSALFKRTGDRQHVARAFAVSESYQLVDLQRLLTEKQALYFGGVSPVAAKMERDLQKKLASLEAEKSGLRFLEAGPETDRISTRLEQQLSAAHYGYDSLLYALEKQFPDYYQLKYKLPIRSLASVQQDVLHAGQCFLKIYAINQDAICLLVRPDTCLLLTTNFDLSVQADLETFLNGLQKYPAISTLPEAEFIKAEAEFANAAARLYTALIAPLAPWLTAEIILAPADIFKGVPFEALLTAPVNQLARPSAWHYWGNEKTISYTSSATIFHFVQQRPTFRSDVQNALVMAPYFPGDLKDAAADDILSSLRADFFTPLPHTGKEAAAVAQLLEGTVAAGKACTIADFLVVAENYKVLHLATHASSGGHGRPAFIAFQPTDNDWRAAMLFESDIYALRLSADLVTLSACETALGKTRFGDGLQGLTRAFTCAGARNVVASLWSVNDASTKRLMILFYQEIKKGLPYNRALANAKRVFIQENRQFAHPYYWAGFVLNGQ